MVITPHPDPNTATRLAFALSEMPGEQMVAHLQSLARQVYAHVRASYGHDQACRFTEDWLDLVVGRLHELARPERWH